MLDEDTITAHKVRAEQFYAHALASGYPRQAEIFKYAAEQIIEHENPKPFEMLGRLNKMPVTIDEFVESEEFLGDLLEVWPALKDDLRAMNPDVFTGAEAVHETLLGGATGTGKTHVGSITNMYQLYLFTCFNEPQRLFNIKLKDPIVFMILSVSPTITKRVIYKPLRETFTAMPYAQKHLTWDKNNESTLTLEGNLVVAPMLASVQSLVGQAIPGALVDEVNFMNVIEDSKQVPGLSGLGGHYDQAELVYTNLSRRRKRTFLTKGFSLGCLCISSSTRYSGDFLDRRIDQVDEFDEKNILTMRRKQYEVAPQDRYSGEKFDYLVSSPDIPGRVLTEADERGVTYPMSGRVEEVPIELRAEFLKDPEGSQRDFIGVATDAISPFIRQRQKINDAVARAKERGIPALIESDQVELATDGMPTFIPENFPATRAGKNKSRWVHVDLSRTGDRCGIAMVRLDGFVNRPVTGTDETEVVPRFTCEIAVGIQPSPVAEVKIAEVRAWVMQLASVYELNIEGISFDGFDSRETIQTLRNAGMRTEVISMDRDTAPYEAVRDALYEDRLDIQEDIELLLTELRTIEYHKKQKKVDHPPKGTKDVSDCLAGAITMALKSRLVRNGMEMVTDGEDNRTQRFKVTRTRTRIERRDRPTRDRPR